MIFPLKPPLTWDFPLPAMFDETEGIYFLHEPVGLAIPMVKHSAWIAHVGRHGADAAEHGHSTTVSFLKNDQTPGCFKLSSL